jgi:DNA-binding NarL/FixJ family response regulator
MTTPINLPPFTAILVDDHVLFGLGFVELVRTMSPQSKVIHVSTIEQAKVELLHNEYNFLFTDLLLPGGMGSVATIDFIRSVKKEKPATIIVVISTVLEISKVKECFSVGCDGYLSKSISYIDLKLAIEQTYNGNKYLSSDLSGKLTSGLFSAEQSYLTNREMEVLRLIAEGHKVKKIAEILITSQYTVMAHRRNIMKKLDLHSAPELVKYAFENNLV